MGPDFLQFLSEIQRQYFTRLGVMFGVVAAAVLVFSTKGESLAVPFYQSNRFWMALLAGEFLVLLQLMLAGLDGRLTHEQVVASGGTGWSVLEHGGWWSDAFIISPLFAYVVSSYEMDWSWRGIVAAIGTFLFAIAFLEFYRRAAMTSGSGVLPDHCTHDGKTTPAGYIHGLFLWIFLWFAVQVYLGLTKPAVSHFDIVWISIVLTPFFYLGVAKLSAEWKFDSGAKTQVAVLSVGLWALTAWRLWH